jgi:hypothetical protein
MCAGCGEPVLGTWYHYEELIPSPEPRHFCAACVRDKPRCDLCRAPVGPRAVTLSDGQYRCGLCASDLVIGEPSVRLNYSNAIEDLAAITGEPLRHTPPLDIVSRRRMGEIRRAYAAGGLDSGLLPALPTGARPRVTRAPKTGSPDGAPVRHLLGFYVRSQGKPLIYVEAGLTRGLLLGTLAHELAHAWQAEQLGHNAGALDPLISEGFAEWVAYNVLFRRGFRTLAARARERSDVYGKGLNRCLQVEAARGRLAVLEVGRTGHF